jgi:hypothetical protein
MFGRVKATGSQIRLSIQNYAAATGVVFVGSSEAANSPATNLAKPGRPFLPWRTTVATDSNVVINFGAAKQIDGVLLVRCNFASVRIQGNTADSWGAPAFNQLYTVAQSQFNWRYQLGVRLTGFNYQYMRIFIPTQTPTDASSAFLLGGVWAGPLEKVPQNFRFDVNLATVQPGQDVAPQSQAWRQRLVLGEPLVRIACMRSSRITEMMPGYQDDLKKWQDIARRIRDNDIFALLLGDVDSSQAYVLRPINEAHWQWTRRRILRAESPWELEEVVGP